MRRKTISQKFADFVNTLSYEQLTGDQIYKLKTFFLDWLGSAYAGQSQQPVQIILDLINGLGGNPQSTIIPNHTKTSSLWAALANGAASHMVEMDDLHRESILHPAAAIMPAVFAIAQREHVSGQDLLVAIAAGYEVGIRVAMGAGPTHYRYWHTTGTCGTFGAAAGASKILGLNKIEFAWALGSAGTQASGLWEFLEENGMSKQLHPGKAAFNGLLSALLAKKGFTGAKKILEGEKGFFKATSRNFNEKKCIENLGSQFMFERNSLKFYASCGHTHSAIEAAIQATGSARFGIDDIERVNVSIYQAAIDLLGNVEPKTPFGAKFNLPFCVATAIKFGHANPDDFNESRLRDPDILNLMSRVFVRNDDELSRHYPRKWPARVEITTNSGNRVNGEVDYPKGDPENPLTETELVEKFSSLTQGLIAPAKANTIIDRVMNLEILSDVGQLLEFTV